MLMLEWTNFEAGRYLACNGHVLSVWPTNLMDIHPTAWKDATDMDSAHMSADPLTTRLSMHACPQLPMDIYGDVKVLRVPRCAGACCAKSR